MRARDAEKAGQTRDDAYSSDGGIEAASPEIVESARRTLRILRCFSAGEPQMGISEIARQLDMHKSTVHRLLNTIELEGFVHRTADGQYALGWRMFELGAAVRGWHATGQIVLRHLQRLVSETSETAHLAVFDEGSVLYVEKVESARPLRMPSAVGKRVPPHCTALGKIFLAALPEDQLWPLVYRPLDRFTPQTIVDPERLRSELDAVRANGFAVDHDEMEEGLMCIAAPIVDDLNVVSGAISISGPTSRMEPRREEYVATVQATGRALSGELGSMARILRELATPPVAR